MQQLKLTLTVVIIFVISLSAGDACVGKILHIGHLNSPQEQVLAEILSVLISERTGTTVKKRSYESSKELYNAVGKREVNIVLENTERSLSILGRRSEENSRTAYDISKEEFRRTLNLVWLEPFSPLSGDRSRGNSFVPVITVDVLTNFPALPRVINKLRGLIPADVLSGLVQSLKKGEGPKKTARDFLKAKKLI